MRRLAITLLGIAACLTLHAQPSQKDSLAFIGADWHWVDLGKGAQAGCAQFQMFGRTETISIVKYPARKHRTSIIHAPAAQAGKTNILAEKEGAKAAINGSYFNVRALTPVTFMVLDHEIISTNPKNESFRSNALMGFRRKHSRMAEFIPYDTLLNDSYAKRYHSCIVSGPLLVKDGKETENDLKSSFNATNHPRSLIGVDAKKNFYFIVVDGRFPGQAEGASVVELQAICRYLGITDAMNLDGGGSSTLWAEKTGILNYPYDNKTYDHEGMRTVPNIIMMK